MTTEHRPVLIVIAGPNGSGKTTITKQILCHHWLEDAIYINPDVVANDVYGDWNSDEAVLKAANYCDYLREQCLANRQSLIFETVLSSPGKLDFIDRAKRVGYFVRLFFVATDSPAINAARIASRVMKGGHNVPTAKIISRYFKSIINCRQASKVADRTYVYDNSVDNRQATLLFRLTDGVMAKQYVSQIPHWAANIVE